MRTIAAAQVGHWISKREPYLGNTSNWTFCISCLFSGFERSNRSMILRDYDSSMGESK